MLYAQSYSLTRVLVDFLVGYVLAPGGVVVVEKAQYGSTQIPKDLASVEKIFKFEKFCQVLMPAQNNSIAAI